MLDSLFFTNAIVRVLIACFVVIVGLNILMRLLGLLLDAYIKLKRL